MHLENIISPNNYRPVALTPVVMKCFERLLLSHIKDSLPAALDPFQFAYRANRSTEDTIALVLQTALYHLERPNTHVRMLFMDYSSAFNTVIPCKLTKKTSSARPEPTALQLDSRFSYEPFPGSETGPLYILHYHSHY